MCGETTNFDNFCDSLDNIIDDFCSLIDGFENMWEEKVSLEYFLKITFE